MTSLFLGTPVECGNKPVMMEDVIRSHLGWLIVWGNVFGGALGILAHAFAVLP